jgi:alpha-glucosidase
MRALANRFSERVLIGEIYLPIQRLVTYYGPSGQGAHLPFNFQLITLPWNARRISAAISEYEGALPAEAWPNWVLGNHDQPRVASRVGLAQARVAAMLLLTLRGTPTLYYGDEIGMRDTVIFPEEIQDPQGKIIGVTRDPARTPMQWSAAQYAGFSSVPPWLPLGHDYEEQANVEAQQQDPSSMLSLYRRLLALRKAEPALSVGTYRPVVAPNPDVLAYIREGGGGRFLVVLNFSPRPAHLLLDDLGTGRIVVATDASREGKPAMGRMVMRGDDAVLVRLE